MLAPGQAYRHPHWREHADPVSTETDLENKVAKGFNTTDVPLEFCLLQGEIAEAFDSWRKGREDAGEELNLADVAIYLLSLAEMTGIDLQDQIEAKMAKNAARVYQRLPNGVLAKRNDNAGQRGLQTLLINTRQASPESTSVAPSGSLESCTATSPGRLRATSTQLPLWPL
jgi:hypothetical protein